MSNTQPSPEDRLTRELIALVEARTAPKAAILQDRITCALAYMNGVTTPNEHTLNHIACYLDGRYDARPPVIPTEETTP